MAESDLTIFCRQIRNRSTENRRALALLQPSGLMGVIMGILRMELDSMVRCIYLLSIADMDYRDRLIRDSVNGTPWRTPGNRGRVTDREMVDLSSKLHGWTRNVYAFGCAFIHLSAFHDYSDLNEYHGLTMNAATRFGDMKLVLPQVFDKIAKNLECYVRDLEAGSSLE